MILNENNLEIIPDAVIDNVDIVSEQQPQETDMGDINLLTASISDLWATIESYNSCIVSTNIDSVKQAYEQVSANALQSISTLQTALKEVSPISEIADTSVEELEEAFKNRHILKYKYAKHLSFKPDKKNFDKNEMDPAEYDAFAHNIAIIPTTTSDFNSSNDVIGFKCKGLADGEFFKYQKSTNAMVIFSLGKNGEIITKTCYKRKNYQTLKDRNYEAEITPEENKVICSNPPMKPSDSIFYKKNNTNSENRGVNT